MPPRLRRARGRGPLVSRRIPNAEVRGAQILACVLGPPFPISRARGDSRGSSYSNSRWPSSGVETLGRAPPSGDDIPIGPAISSMGLRVGGTLWNPCCRAVSYRLNRARITGRMPVVFNPQSSRCRRACFQSSLSIQSRGSLSSLMVI